MEKLTQMKMHAQEQVHAMSQTDFKELLVTATFQSVFHALNTFFSQAKAQALASTPVVAQPACVLGGDCQSIMHPSLSTFLCGMAINKEGHLFVSVWVDQSIKVFSREGPNGEYIKTIGWGKFSCVGGIAIDREDTLYMADCGAHIVRVFDKQGNHVRDVGRGHLIAPQSVAVDEQGCAYVADGSSNVVSVFDRHGEFVRDLGVRASQGNGDPKPNFPFAVAVDWRRQRLHQQI
jgi:DNA-binding beta-propeller fold protein YncE